MDHSKEGITLRITYIYIYKSICLIATEFPLGGITLLRTHLDAPAKLGFEFQKLFRDDTNIKNCN
jgi:hypothetical protein